MQNKLNDFNSIVLKFETNTTIRYEYDCDLPVITRIQRSIKKINLWVDEFVQYSLTKRNTVYTVSKTMRIYRTMFLNVYLTATHY